MGKISVKEGMKEGLRKVHVFGGWVCVGVGWGGVGSWREIQRQGDTNKYSTYDPLSILTPTL